MATLYLPDVRKDISRLATGTNPEYEQIVSPVQDWLASFQKISPGKWNQVRDCCLSAALNYPVADKEQLYVTAQWTLILFTWDDTFDDLEDNRMQDTQGANEVNKLVMSVFDHPERPGTQSDIPVVAAVRSFWTSFRANSTPTVQKRFPPTIHVSAQGLARLVRNREKRRIPSKEEFTSLRRLTSGVESCFAAVEYSLGIEVPDEAIHHATMQELRDELNNIISWTNDLYSFNKEQAIGDYQNLVAVVAIEKDIDVQSAVESVFTMILSAINRYFEAKACLPKFDPQTDVLVSKYVRGIECVCSGFVLWHFEIERYFGSKIGEVEDRLAVKVLSRENGALDPGFQLRYNSPSAVTASVGHEQSMSDDVPRLASPEPLL